MPITALPTPPNRNSPTTFADDGDEFLGALPTFGTELNTLTDTVVAAEANCIAAAAAAGATLWVSGTTYAAGNARYSPIDFQTYRRKTAGAGTTDPSLDSTNWARLNVAAPSVTRTVRTSNTILVEADRSTLIDITSGTFSQTFTAAATLTTGWFCWIKNSGTGVITLDPNASETINGATTLTVPAGQTLLVQSDGTNLNAVVIDGSVGDHSVTVTTGNGRGSTNTCIRRFTTTLSSSGTAITYADSATLGASFTINAAGLYAISYSDNYAASSQPHGVSLNSAQLTTGITTITAANRLGMIYALAGGVSNVLTLVTRLAVNDVVRPHETGINNATGVADTYFSIRRIGS